MKSDLKKEVLHLIKKYGVTAYEIEKHTDLSAVGVQKFIDGKTLNPQTRTLEAIKSYITNRYYQPCEESLTLNEERVEYNGPSNQLEEKERAIRILENYLNDKERTIKDKEELLSFHKTEIYRLKNELNAFKSGKPLSKTTDK